jgi:hypothetical protein
MKKGGGLKKGRTGDGRTWTNQDESGRTRTTNPDEPGQLTLTNPDQPGRLTWTNLDEPRRLTQTNPDEPGRLTQTNPDDKPGQIRTTNLATNPDKKNLDDEPGRRTNLDNER